MNTILFIRNEFQLNMQELGDILDIANSTICKYESGTRKPSTNIMLSIMEKFRIMATKFIICLYEYNSGISR